MTSDPVTCRKDDKIEAALDSMSRRQIRRIPIVDDSNCVIGIIAQADVATRIGDSDRTGDVVEEISK
jgi:CBS domain-containing protein